jgi:nitrile hydratase
MPHDHPSHDQSPHDDAYALLPPEPQLRLKALETILIEKGLIDPAAIDEIVDLYAHEIGPHRGAGLVAKAWSDAGFKERLLNDTAALLDEMGLAGRQGERVEVLENTSAVHNMVVCTLCSCYPWPLLGIPPSWYKSDAYRKRAVREPRQVLAEFGVKLMDSQKVKVWDSTSEIRYLVLPMQPQSSYGLDASVLVNWVHRDSMIGTGLPCDPVRHSNGGRDE